MLSVAGYAAAAVLGGHATAETLLVFAALLSTATVMGVSQAVNRERQRRELQTLSRSDPLTGALNRRGFTERFAAELCDHVRHDGRPLGLIVIDLDDFKAVNDTRGHAAGDDLLCAVRARSRPTSARPTCSAASAATSSRSCCPRRARASCARLRRGSSSGSAPSPPPRSASPRCPSTASPPRTCTAPPTPTCTAPSSGGSSARRRGSWPWGPSRQLAAQRAGPERPGDHHLLDLVGALADGEDLRVAVEAAHRVLLDVAVAAVDLHGLLGAAHRQAAGLELGLGGGQREVPARVLRAAPPCR